MLSEESGLSHDVIRGLLVQYCFLPTAAARNDLLQRYPELFHGELLEALNDAREVLQSTASAYDDSERMFTSLMRQLDLPSESRALGPSSEAVEDYRVPSQSATHGADVTRNEFATLLANLLRAAPAEESQHTNVVGSDDALPATIACAPQSGGALQSSSWSRNDTLVVEVFSYLPAETLFNVCENTCQYWRVLLCDGVVANSIWIGIVQREFPKQLAKALSAQCDDPNVDVWDNDWRVIAMLAVCEEDGTMEELIAG